MGAAVRNGQIAPPASEGGRRAQRPVQVALALLTCIVVALVATGAFAAYHIYQVGNQRFVDQAAPFFAVTEDLAVEMLNEETGVRGYVITQDPKTLAPYRQGKKYVQAELALIANDASIDPRIPADLAAVRREVNSLQRFFANEIALVRSGPAGRRRAQAAMLDEKEHFDHLRAGSGALIADAANVIKRSQRDQHSTLVTWLVGLGIAGAAAILIAVGLLLRVPRRLYELLQQERAARHEAEESAEAARALAHVREAVVLLDDGGDVRYWNPAAETLLGLTHPNVDAARLREVLAGVEAADGRAGARPLEVDGQERWLLPFESRFDGGRVVVFRDVSEDYRLERLRSDFVATAAHELRTPLAAVYGAVRTLRKQGEVLPEALQTRFLEMIENESERLKVVMDQLLVSAQLDSGNLVVHRERVDAGRLCEELLGAAGVRKPPEIELALDGPAGAVYLDADPDRLRQVVANLVDNAIKYSPGGGRVHVRVSSRGRWGVIEVADQGLGIPPEEQRRIFEKFYRLDPSMTQGVGGSGLGLYISRELMQQMGGQLSVVSSFGSGSTFSVTVPLAPSSERVTA